jgi:hypothetical protein
MELTPGSALLPGCAQGPRLSPVSLRPASPFGALARSPVYRDERLSTLVGRQGFQSSPQEGSGGVAWIYGDQVVVLVSSRRGRSGVDSAIFIIIICPRLLEYTRQWEYQQINEGRLHVDLGSYIGRHGLLMRFALRMLL